MNKPKNQPNDVASPLREEFGPIETSTPKLGTESDLEGQERVPSTGINNASNGLAASVENSYRLDVGSSQNEHGGTRQTLELTPLLPDPVPDLENARLEETELDFRPKRGNLKRWSIFAFPLVLLLLVICAIGLTLRDIESLLNVAVIPQIDAVSVLNITDLGVSAHVVGNVTVSYDNIDNWLQRSVLKVSGVLAGPVTVTSSETVRVSVSGPGFNEAHTLDVLPPEMVVDLVNGRTSPIDFISDTKLVDSGLQTVVNYILSHKNENVSLDFDLLLSPKVSTRWLHYNGGPLELTHNLVVLPDNTQLPVNVNDINTEFGKDYLSLSVSATIEPLPVEFSLKPAEWDISLLDCDGKPSLLGVWTSNSVFFKPSVPTDVNLIGSVSHVPPELLKVCSDGFSPFNRFTQELFEQNLVHVWVSATKSDLNSKNLMPWLYKVLTLAVVEVEAPIPPQNDLLSNPLSSFTLDHMDLRIPPLLEDDSFYFFADSRMSAVANIPAKNGFSIAASRILSNFTLSVEDHSVFLGSTINSNALIVTSCAKSCLNSVQCDFRDLNVTVVDPERMGKAISQILNGKFHSPLSFGADIDLVNVDLELFSTTLRNISLSGSNIYTPMENFNKNRSSLFIEWLFANANITIGEVVYVGSSPEKLDLLVELEMTNPTNVSMNIGDVIEVEYHYNQTQIGTVSMHAKNISGNNTRQTIEANIQIDSKQPVFVSEFLSRIVSGLPLTVDLKGKKRELGFGRMMGNIGVQNVKVPLLSFSRPEDEKVEDKENGEAHSPFLISTTIHIWTSEIELMVYNPLVNAEIAVKIENCQALYEDELLAHVEESELILIPPGIYKTPRIPVQISKGIGADILRKAINGELQVEVFAELEVFVARFSLEIMYHGQGLTATVRL
ncbi:hypothetical protein PUMCH_001463 [Australozyma saopauloensis]|uniref:Tag1-like fifth Ig-like domain-containing protein n=1 Tax=Australozyma saopauloensis TaxID=291208 RepID=A0AAX4H6W3_9ASCO|nr:hypothetical protein PUMCH_001463 [[Candida] saopauloensis]